MKQESFPTPAPPPPPPPPPPTYGEVYPTAELGYQQQQPNPFADESKPIENPFVVVFGRVKTPVRNAFVAKVLGIVALQLVMTCLVASFIYVVAPIREYVRTNVWTTIVGYIAVIGLMIALHFLGRRKPVNIILFVIFTLVFGWVIGTVACFYTVPSLLIAASLTIVIVCTLSVIAIFSRHDFSWVAGLIAVLSIAFFPMVLIMIIAPWPWLRTLYATFAVTLFSLMILFNVWRLSKGDSDPDDWVMAAISIYVETVSIFLALLVGMRR